jgi:heavy metal translocating P-type ATPase
MRTQAQYFCAHCGNATSFPVFNQDKSQIFCCLGCRTVFNLIHEKGFSEYYNLKKSFKESEPVLMSKNDFSYLDQPEFQKNFVQKISHHQVIQFYLEGIHCVACVWLIEKVCGLIEGVESLKVNLETSTVKVFLNETSKISLVAKELSSLGYKVIPLKNEEERNKLIKKEEKNLLIKTGVAFGLTGNIMLMSLALYGGADAQWKFNFEFIAVLLSIPLVFYCATPFYQNIFSLLKRKQISLDLPIVLAIWGAFYFSVQSLIDNGDRIYADSMGMLISFLLLSRFILFKVQKSSKIDDRVTTLFNYHAVKKQVNEAWVQVISSSLKINDIIKVEPGESIPVDGVILSGESYVNQSLLTGESYPIKKISGEEIWAGSVNNQNTLTIKVTSQYNESRLSKIFKQLEVKQTPTSIQRLADSFSKYFLWAIFLIAGLTMLSLFIMGNPYEGIYRAITVIIVSCPCVFGMSIPLSMSQSLKMLAEKGIVVKDDFTLEKLTNIKNIIWDKTGTLTYGQLTMVSIDDSIKDEFGIILSLEQFSKHPIAIAIKNYAEINHFDSDLKLHDIKEVNGVGVSGYWGKNYYELKSIKNESEDYIISVGLFLEGQFLGGMNFSDNIRSDAFTTINTLKQQTHFILTGDKTNNGKKIAKKLNISNLHCELSPEDKAKFVKNTPYAMMVGDGANDALALKEAYVSVAVKGALEESMKASDIYLTKYGLEKITLILSVAHESIKLMKRNLIFSVVYNVVGVTLAIMGFMTPMIAAILMPLSSLTILFSTLYKTKKLREIN